MKGLVLLMKTSIKTWLPLFVLNGLLVLTVFLFNKYWFLQPLWQAYVLVLLLQFSGWLFVLRLNRINLTEVKDEFSLPIKTAFFIGLIWSVIQIFWLKQWWTWLNLFSQPFIYAIFAVLFINLYIFTIDQINKIRHHDVG